MTDAAPLLAPCIGCGALVPVIENGAVHPYIGASAGCWAVYGEVLARQYNHPEYASVLRLTGDTYAVQHPGTPSRQSIQSVAVHLISLYWALEHHHTAQMTTQAIYQALQHRGDFVWLKPPTLLGAMTILDIRAAHDFADLAERVNQWAASVWKAWSAHHETIARWARQGA